MAIFNSYVKLPEGSHYNLHQIPERHPNLIVHETPKNESFQ